MSWPATAVRLSDADADIALNELRQAAQTAAAEADIAARRTQADAAIVPLQDAVDLAMATPAEAELLAAWRRYRVELSRVPQQPGFPTQIDWPARPE